MTQAERLNNAIVRLDWLHGNALEVRELARDWATWWHGPKRFTPVGSSEWWGILQFYWLRYRAAYARLPKVGLATPDEVNPTRIEPERLQVVAGAADTPAEIKKLSFPWGVALGAVGALSLMLLLKKD